jgi:hypothetical protein
METASRGALAAQQDSWRRDFANRDWRRPQRRRKQAAECESLA